jgi:hypothetical protein
MEENTFDKFENCKKTPLKWMYLDRGDQKLTCKVENFNEWSVSNGVCKSYHPGALSSGTSDYIRVLSRKEV